MAELTPGSSPITNPLIERFFLSPAEKSSLEKGKAIVKEFYRLQTSNSDNNNYFNLRNKRQVELLLWAKGSQKMTEFLDYMNVSDANKAWNNIDLTQSRIGAQFVGTLVESMAKNRVYPCVKAIDSGSLGEKEQRLFDALFRMHEAEMVNALQQAAGMQLEPSNAYIPDDEMAAKVYFAMEDQLPKEIKFEEMLKRVMNEIDFETVANRKTLFDFIVLNIGCTKIERCAPKEYKVRKCIGPNMVYNFFMSDTGKVEITEIGEFYNIKVKEFRQKFLKSADNPNGLTEKEIFELAKLSTNKNIGQFNYQWNDVWTLTTYTWDRPYDDCSILVLDVEIDCGEDVYYVEKTDPYGRPNITPKKGIPYQQKTKDGKIIQQDIPEGTEIIKRRKNSWMRGVYAPYGDKMLYWGAPDIIITPFTNTARPLSSYSINIPNNDGDYVPSLFERGMEILREYQLAKLKRKQLIAKIKPSGIRIDVESARNIDLGNGDSIAWEEVMRIYDQTGNEVWSSRGIDPLSREAPPLSNTVRTPAIEDVIGLTNIMTGMVAELRQIWGVPSYRDGSDVGDRTPAKLAEGQNESSFNVTDFIQNANNQLWQETFYKLCLLHWNDIVKEEPESKSDMLNTRFDVSIRMKSTDYEKQLIEADIQRYSQMPDATGSPSLSLKDAMMIRQIDDYKLACWYLSSTVEKNLRDAEKRKQAINQQTIQGQQQSSAQSAQQQAQLQAQQAMIEDKAKEKEFQHQKELALLTILGGVMSKTGGEIPPILQPLAQQMFQNVSMDVVMDNIVTKMEIQEVSASMQQAQQPQQSEQQIQPQ